MSRLSYLPYDVKHANSELTKPEYHSWPPPTSYLYSQQPMDLFSEVVYVITATLVDIL